MTVASLVTAVVAAAATAAIQEILTSLRNRDWHVCDEILEPAVGAEIYVYFYQLLYLTKRDGRKRQTLIILHRLFFGLSFPVFWISLLCGSSQPP